MSLNIEELKQQFWDATNYGLQFFEDEFSSEIAKNRGASKALRFAPMMTRVRAISTKKVIILIHLPILETVDTTTKEKTPLIT